jgi:farnesyl diphosphate synthase
MGKIGTDIEESKCSWLIVQALDRVNEEQKLELKQNYGKTSEENVKKVKSIFNELNLKEAYKIFEENQYKLINEKIDNLNVDDSRIKILLNLYVKKIFKRNS